MRRKKARKRKTITLGRIQKKRSICVPAAQRIQSLFGNGEIPITRENIARFAARHGGHTWLAWFITWGTSLTLSNKVARYLQPEPAKVPPMRAFPSHGLWWWSCGLFVDRGRLERRLRKMPKERLQEAAFQIISLMK